MYIVLYSRKDAVWKLADFGLTSEAVATRQTSNSKGSEGYRAPELLQLLLGKKPVYNSKVDIWSIGCILFELAACQKAFLYDWKTWEYFQSFTRALDIPLDESFSERCKETIGGIIRSTLALTYSSRPSAADLENEFVKIFISNQALPRNAVRIHQSFHQVQAVSIGGVKPHYWN